MARVIPSLSRCRVVFVVVLIALIFPTMAVIAAPVALPERHIIAGVPVVGQYWNLSCEYAAASAVTQFYGATVPQGTFLKAIGYDENPHRGFRGNINGAWGGTTNYGIYAEPIATMLRKNGYAHAYAFYGGADDLRHTIASGTPMVAWISGTWGATTRTAHIDDSGEKFSLVRYEHAVTVYGYDAARVYIMDPGTATKYSVGWPTFLRGWQQLDGMALAIAP